jgi:hypothetical protein
MMKQAGSVRFTDGISSDEAYVSRKVALAV